MSPFPWFNLAVLVGLILLNGVFAMSELAIVSARTALLRIEAENGNKAAQTALSLAASPGKFLSTVQIGITLVGIVAGAYSGATLGGPTGERLAALGVADHLAQDAGFILVIALTTYFSLVIGELVPKQVALRAAIPIALVMARPMAFLARAAAPFVWLLDTSSSLIMRVIGVQHEGQHSLSAKELHMVFADATRSGLIEEQERAILSGIMRMAERPVRELMTPRTELDWIDIGVSPGELDEAIAASPHSLLPVADGSPDKVLGVVKVREVLALQLAGSPVRLSDLLRKAEVLPDQLDAMDALRMLQHSGIGMAMVHDEYGHFEGVVTPADLLKAIAGSFASHLDEGDEPELEERADGSMLISGAMTADELALRLGIQMPEGREFATAAGFVLFMLKRLPQEGESFEDQGWLFEVARLNGRKINKLLVRRVKEQP